MSLSAGIIYMFIASFFFALMNASVKALSPDISTVENMFFRSFFMSILMLSIILLKKEKIKKRPGRWWGLLFRAGMGSISLIALFYNLATIPLGTATTFSQTTPLYAIFFAAIILKDKISILSILSSIVGFIGVFFICNPKGSSLATINIIMGILSGSGAALALVTLRTLKDYFSNNFIIFFFGATTGILSLGMFFIPNFFIQNTWNTPNLIQWSIIILMSLGGTLGQHFLTKAYMTAPPGIVAPIDYIKILWGIVMGFFLGDALPDINSWIGIILVVLSGIIIALPIFIHDYKELKTKSKNVSKVLSER